MITQLINENIAEIIKRIDAKRFLEAIILFA